MRKVAIAGVGMTPVGEHWNKSLRQLGVDAVRLALDDAQINSIDALYVGNAFGSVFSSQSQLGALIADSSGLSGVEAFTIDAAGASGGAALRAGYLAVASGAVETALVLGVEKSTDTVGSARVAARNISIDADFEAIHGVTLPALSALLMRRYMYQYAVDLMAFEGFSLNAHANGSLNQHAMFRNKLRAGAFAKAPMIAEPVNLFDGAPDADGSAAVVLMSLDRAMDRVPQPVEISGSAVATDTFALQDRDDLLTLQAVERSSHQALAQAGIDFADLDLIELHDSFTILSALALESMGAAERGRGCELAADSGQHISLTGRMPISTFGGLKSRGNPVGATGVYQAVESTLQLRGEAAENQVKDAQVAAVQNLAGIATTAVTHILSTVK